MDNMHVMYAHELSVTLRIESLTPAERWEKALREDEVITVFHAESSVVEPVLIKDLVHNPTPYNNRGWCIGEMEWSSDRQETAQNQLIDICRDSDTAGQQGDGPELLGRVPTSPEHFAVKMDTAAFTHREDADAVVHLQEKIFLEKVKRNESLNLEGLPRSEFQRLLHALPYFEVLQSIALGDFECSQEEAEAFAKVGFWNSFMVKDFATRPACSKIIEYHGLQFTPISHGLHLSWWNIAVKWLTVYPSFQAAWFKGLPARFHQYMWPCRHVAMYDPSVWSTSSTHIPIQKAVGKSLHIIELCFTLTPKSEGPKSDPKFSFLLSRPCDKRRCWSFTAGPIANTKRASIIWSRQAEGQFQVPVFPVFPLHFATYHHIGVSCRYSLQT